MEIREGQNSVTIEPVDRVPVDLPTAGDVRLWVGVASEQFSGQGFAWVARLRGYFLGTTARPGGDAQGEATIEGLSPGEFRLRIWSVDRWGHMAVGGLVTNAYTRERAAPIVILWSSASRSTRHCCQQCWLVFRQSLRAAANKRFKLTGAAHAGFTSCEVTTGGPGSLTVAVELNRCAVVLWCQFMSSVELL